MDHPSSFCPTALQRHEHQCGLYPPLYEMCVQLLSSQLVGTSFSLCAFLSWRQDLASSSSNFLSNGNKLGFCLIKLRSEGSTKHSHWPPLVQEELILISRVLHPWPVISVPRMPIISMFNIGYSQ